MLRWKRVVLYVDDRSDRGAGRHRLPAVVRGRPGPGPRGPAADPVRGSDPVRIAGQLRDDLRELHAADRVRHAPCLARPRPRRRRPFGLVSGRGGRPGRTRALDLADGLEQARRVGGGPASPRGLPEGPRRRRAGRKRRLGLRGGRRALPRRPDPVDRRGAGRQLPRREPRDRGRRVGVYAHVRPVGGRRSRDRRPRARAVRRQRGPLGRGPDDQQLPVRREHLEWRDRRALGRADVGARSVRPAHPGGPDGRPDDRRDGSDRPRRHRVPDRRHRREAIRGRRRRAPRSSWSPRAT